MNTNPVTKAYTNLGIVEDKEEVKPVMGTGLLSRNIEPKDTPKLNQPLDRVKQYVKNIRNARKQITNG